jgi:HlyD family secretion protein
MGCFEVASVMLIAPFMTLLGDLESIESNNLLNYLYQFLEFNSVENFIIFFGAVVLFFMIFSAAFSLYTTNILYKFGGRIGGSLSERVFRYFLYQPWSFHNRNSSSNLIHKVINESQRLTFSIITQVLNLNAKLALALLMSIAIILYSPMISIFALTIFSLLYFAIFKLSKSSLDQVSQSLSKDQSLRMKTSTESFGGIQNIILHSTQSHFTNRFENHTSQYYKSWSKSQILSITPKYILEVLAMGSVVVLVLFLFLTGDKSTSQVLPVISVFALAGFKILPALQQVYYSFSIINANLSAFINLENDLTSSPPKLFYRERDIAHNNSFTKTKKYQKVEFDNISFSYNNSNQKVLDGISFSINTDTTIGIVGPSGSGKSTIVDLLLGLIEPVDGSIFLDRQPLDQSNISNWQRSLGFVPQNIFLADESIRQNIAFGIDNKFIDEKKIHDAAELSNIMDFVSKLPQGLDTQVGERGLQLSGGQIQRIGIARALYHNPDILIFDEATSALDGISEKLIMQSINNFYGKKTVIIVAHRLDTVKKADNILLCDAGKIIDHGKYDELIDRSIVFQKMAGQNQITD